MALEADRKEEVKMVVENGISTFSTVANEQKETLLYVLDIAAFDSDFKLD
jgi:hypothetical protein